MKSLSLPSHYRALVLNAVCTGSSSDEFSKNFSLINKPLQIPTFSISTDGKRNKKGKDMLLVRVRACALGYRDLLDCKGAYKGIKLPAVLGHEFSGTVVAIGEEPVREGDDNGPKKASEEIKVDPVATVPAHKFAVGDKVVALHWDQSRAWPSPFIGDITKNYWVGLTTDGGYADYFTAPAGTFVPAPVEPGQRGSSNNNTSSFGIPLRDASCIVSTFGTAYEALFNKAEIQPGQRLLVTGASGGVGTAAVIMAKSHGCHVTALTNSTDKVEYLQNTLKCDEVVIGNVKKGTDTRGCSLCEFKLKKKCDAVIEAVGGPTFSSALRSMKPGGTMVIIGNVENSTMPLPLGYCILNSLRVWGTNSIRGDTMVSGLYEFMYKHKISPVIHSVISLKEIPKALEMLEQGKVSGRIVVDMELP